MQLYLVVEGLTILSQGKVYISRNIYYGSSLRICVPSSLLVISNILLFWQLMRSYAWYVKENNISWSWLQPSQDWDSVKIKVVSFIIHMTILNIINSDWVQCVLYAKHTPTRDQD